VDWFSINPANSSLFPWLSRVAKSYEEYQFTDLAFRFKSTSGTAVGSTNTALGTVVMATNYDVSDAVFTSKQQMEAYQGANSTVPSGDLLHRVDVVPRRTPLPELYVASGEISSDAHFYHLGKFQVATAGSQAAAVLGELWVEYTVKLMKPKLPSDMYTESFALYSESPTGTASTANGMGSTGPELRYRTSDVFVTAPPGTSNITVTFNRAGWYYVMYSMTNSSPAGAGGFATTGGAAIMPVWNKSLGGSINLYGAGGSVMAVVVNITDTSTAALYITPPGSVGSAKVDLMVSSVPSGIPVVALAAHIRQAQLRYEMIDNPASLSSAACQTPSATTLSSATEEKGSWFRR
jgi:hypothetical protein